MLMVAYLHVQMLEIMIDRKELHLLLHLPHNLSFHSRVSELHVLVLLKFVDLDAAIRVPIWELSADFLEVAQLVQFFLHGILSLENIQFLNDALYLELLAVDLPLQVGILVIQVVVLSSVLLNLVFHVPVFFSLIDQFIFQLLDRLFVFRLLLISFEIVRLLELIELLNL